MFENWKAAPRSLLACSVVLVAILLFSPGVSVAQRSSGTILGTVQDASGAVMPGVQVAVSNVGTRISQHTRTDERGDFIFPNLQVGTYQLRVEAPGFKVSLTSGIVLDVDANRRVNAVLQPGELTETIDVVSQAPLVNTDDAAVSQVIAHKMIVDLPLNGRDYQQLALLSPGTVSTGMAEGTYAANSTVIVANGGRPGKTEFLVDGSDVFDYFSRATLLVPALDAIAEFNHQKSQFSAEFGFGNSAMSVVVRSGTNALHGTLWEFLRNNAFDARSFFSSSRPNPLKRNQFGVSAGGPVYIPRVYDGRNRTFFFFSFEGLRQRSSGNSFATVPLPEFWSGDFSALRTSLYDPSTTRPHPTTAGRYVRDPFPGNRIPESKLDPVARYYRQFFPVPNVPGALSLNHSLEIPSRGTTNQYLLRMDHRLSDRNSLTGRFTRDNAVSLSNGPYYPLPAGASHSLTPVHDGVITFTRLFGAATILEARTSVARINKLTTSPSIGGTDHTAASGITGLGPTTGMYPGHPDFSYTAYTGLSGGGQNPFRSPRTNFAWAASLSAVRGAHTLKFGTNVRVARFTAIHAGQGRGAFSYSGTYTGDVFTSGRGDAFADFMLGFPFSSSRYPPPHPGYQSYKSYAGYAQDDWKVTPRLTLNLGVRYDLMLPVSFKYNQFSTFAPWLRDGRGGIVVPTRESIEKPVNEVVPSALPIYRSLIFVSEDVGLSPSLRVADKNNMAPRFGFAFRPWGGSSMVIRGGYGIYFLTFDGNRQTEWRTIPFLVRETSLTNSTPIPSRTTAQFFPAGGTFDPRATITAQELNFQHGYMQQFSLGVQHALPYHMALDVSYVGSKGTKLERMRALNDPLPGPGDVEARRPYPDFRGISYREGSAPSIYHSLQVKVERRWTSGLQLLVGYTNSKLIDEGSADNTVALDPRNFRLSRGLADYDISQRITFSGTYALPFLSGVSNPFLRHALSGWNLSGTANIRSGLPFTASWSGPVPNTGVSSVRANRIGSGKLANPTVDRWFDVAAFVAPEQYTYGNSGRNILRADGAASTDLSIFKEFGRESSPRRVQVRGEFFNAFNHPDFGAPNATINTPTAGVTRNVSYPRIIQLGVKVYY